MTQKIKGDLPVNMAETVNCDRNGIRVITLTNLDNDLGYDVKALMETAIKLFENAQGDKSDTAAYLMTVTEEYFAMECFSPELAAELFPTREEAEHALREASLILTELCEEFEVCYTQFKERLSFRYEEAFAYLYYHAAGQSVVDNTPLGSYLMDLRCRRNLALRSLWAVTGGKDGF